MMEMDAQLTGLDTLESRDPWHPLESVRIEARRIHALRSPEAKVNIEPGQEALRESLGDLGVNVEDPNEIRLVMLGAGMLWHVQEVVTIGCKDQEHVMLHINDGATRLLSILEENAQRLGVRNPVEEVPDADQSE